MELVIIHHQSSIMVFQHQQLVDGDGAHTPSIIHYGFPSPPNIWWRWWSHTTNYVLWVSITTKCFIAVFNCYFDLLSSSNNSNVLYFWWYFITIRPVVHACHSKDVNGFRWKDVSTWSACHVTAVTRGCCDRGRYQACLVFR